jgi:hypothetical protein
LASVTLAQECQQLILHYLSLVLGEPSYVSAAAIRFDDGGVAMSTQQFYASERDLEERIEGLLRNPVPLKRYEGKIDWHQLPLPTPFGTSFAALGPVLNGSPVAAPND